MVPFDEDEGRPEASNDFIINRRDFIGSAVATTAAVSGAFAQTPQKRDDLALEFVWSDDEIGRYLTVIAVVGTRKEALPKPAGAAARSLRREVERDKVEGREAVWRLRPETFGPNTVVTYKPVGSHNHELRLSNVSYGRVRGRELTFKFYRRERRSDQRVQPFFFYGIALQDDVWSTARNVLVTHNFTLEDEVPKGILGTAEASLDLRQFGSGASALTRDTTAKAVTNTYRLMFNGLLGLGPGQRNRKVWVRFDRDGKWSVAPVNPSATEPFTVLGKRDEVSTLEVYWQAPQEGGTSDAQIETPLLGLCRPKAEAPERVYRIGGRDGPGLWVNRVAWPSQGAREDRYIALRMQSLTGKNGQSTGQVRAEAVLTGPFEALSFSGTGADGPTGPFPRLWGAILERVDAPAAASSTDHANRAGTISFQGSYGYIDKSGGDGPSTLKEQFAPIGMTTVVGKIVATGVTPEKQKVLAERHPEFPERVGWPVKALFSWLRNRAGRREAPVTSWIDARVAMLEAGVELAEADFSRLNFEPSELRFFYEKTALTSPPIGSYIDLSAPRAGELARFDLSRATLRASRSHDLVSLAFRFSDLALSFSRQRTQIIKLTALCDIGTRPAAEGRLQPHDTRPVVVVEYPGQHLFEEARFLPSPPPMADVTIPVGLVVNRPDGSIRERILYEDDAFLENFKNMERGEQPEFAITRDSVTLDANNRLHVVDALALFDDANARTTLRQELFDLKTWIADPVPTNEPFILRKREEFRDFYEGKGANKSAKQALEDLVDRSNLPADQKIYIGPFALDADAMQAVRLVHEASFEDILKGLVDDMFAAVVRNRSATPLGSLQDALRQERRLESAIPTYQLFRTFYREVMIASYFDPTSNNVRAAESLEPEEVEFFEASRGAGPTWVTPARKLILQRRAEAVVALFPKELRGQDDGMGPLRGRLARPSRLAFRINCPDGIDKAEVRHKDALDLDEDAAVRLPRKVLDFTLGELTNFKDYELAVTARAETVHDGGRLGLIDPRHPRVPDRRPGAMLDHLGFTDGPGVTAARRLAEVAVSLVPPTPLETAIEIPSRLTLSPHQDAIVLTPGEVEPTVYDDYAPGAGSVDGPRVSRLWVTSFLTNKNDVGMDPGLRAVHSPDLRPEALLQRMSLTGDNRSPGNGAPARGPVAPWLISRLETQRPLMSGEDAIKQADVLLKYETSTTCEGLLDDPNVRKRYPKIVADLCRIFALNAPENGVPTGFRSGLDAYMRHELVLLSSAWGLPVVGATNESGDFQDRASQFEPDERHKLVDVMPGTAMYRPRAMDVSELGLSSLGGILRHDTGFEPPAGALFWLDNKSLFDALAIERWQQWTNLGRDIHTEIVFKGYLFPLGIRASLVQVTERTFLIEQGTGAITATLRQRMFIRVANPERSYPGIKQPHAGRRFPVDRLRVLTTTTPDIVDPQSPPRGAVSETKVISNGRIDTKSATGLAFWPRFVQAPEGNIRFETDIDGVKTDMPLIFIDNTAVNDQDTLRELIDYYNHDSGTAGVPSPDNQKEQMAGAGGQLKDLTRLDPAKHLRTINFRGENRRYAPELEAGSATFQTHHWTLRATGGADGYDNVTPPEKGAPSMAKGIALKEKLSVVNTDFVFGPIRTGADQPPFYPAIETARIRLTQAERLAARPLGPVRVHFDARYVLHGLEPAEGAVPEPLDTLNPNEVFLVVRDQCRLDMGRKGDQSGGVYRPSGHVAALSRKKGLMTLTNHVEMPNMPSFGNDVLYGMSSLFAFDDQAHKKLGVSAGEVAGQSEDADDQAREVIDKVRAIYRNFFSGDAKILGIVKLRDVIELIKDLALASPDEGLPALSEAQEFGANVAEGANDIANTVREEVVAPLASGAREVRAGWDRIEETIQVAQGQVGVTTSAIQIRDVFPELDKALTNLSKALDRAEATTDPIEFGFELSVCYTAGQRFLTEIQRAAANPGERIEAAFSAQFGQLLGLFQGALSGREELLRALLGVLLEELGQAGKSLGQIRKELIEEYLLEKLPDLIGDTDPNEKGNPLRRREMISLPRGAYWYDSDGGFDPDKDKVLLECLKVLLPSDELVKKTVEGFVAFAATEVLSTGTFPDLDALVVGFLDYKPVAPPRECKLDGGLSAYLSCIRAKHVQLDVNFKKDKAQALTQELKDRLAEIRSNASGWGLSSAQEAGVRRIIDDLARKLDDISVEVEGARVLNQGTVGERIRNHYIVCLITNFPDGSGKSVDLGTVELRQFRIDLLKYLPRLVLPPVEFLEDFLPDLSRLFGPLGRLLGAIGEIQASLLPDIDVDRFLAAIRDFLDQMGLPISFGSLEGFKAYFCPTWEVARAFMADLSAVAEGAALCSDGLTLPSCPLNNGIFNDLADETIALPEDDISLCTESLRFATSAHALRTVLEVEVGQRLLELKVALEGQVPPTPKHVETLRRVNIALADMGEADTCLLKIRDLSEAVYCDIQADTARLNTLARDLKAASELDFCAMTEIGQVIAAFDQIKALTNLPRDFEAFLDARERVLNRINRFFVEIVTILQDDSTCWRGIPILVGLKPFIEDFELGTVNGDDIVVDDGLSDVAGQVEAYFEDVKEAGAQITAMLTQYAKTVCGYAAVLDDLKTHLDGFEGLLKELEDSEDYGAQIADFLRKNVDKERLLQQIGAIGDDVVRIIDLRDKYCPPVNPPEFPTLGALADVKIGDESGLDFIGASNSAVSRVAAGLKNVARDLSPVAAILRPIAEKGPRDGVLEVLDPLAVKVIENAGDPFVELYDTLKTGRDALGDQLDGIPFLGEVKSRIFIPPNAARPRNDQSRPIYVPFVSNNTNEPGPDNDQLAGDLAWLSTLTLAPTDKPAPAPLSDPQRFAFLNAFITEWANGEATPVVILLNLRDVIEDVLKGDFFRAIDFNRLREEFEEYLLSLVPTTIRMGYNFDIELGSEVASATRGIFTPGPGTALNVAMNINVALNLEDGTADIDYASVGTLGPFDIKLVGDMFDALTLKFASARFESKSEQKPRFDIEYLDYEIGPELDFLEDLQSFLSPKDGSGAFVRFDPSQPGVEAGYRLQLGDFSVGTLAFSNVGLETSAVLPFSDSEALFRASLSSRASPFTLTYAPYGGSGFFAILATPGSGIIGFEALFEFGGSAVFAFGPLSGKGRLMSGVYVRQFKMGNVKVTEISMTFFAGGSASIWIFHFAASLLVNLGMVNGNMSGQATFSFSFSMGLADFEYSVDIWKQEEKGFNGQEQASVMGPDGLRRYAFLQPQDGQATRKLREARIKVDAVCQSEDCETYNTYFDDIALPGDYF